MAATESASVRDLGSLEIRRNQPNLFTAHLAGQQVGRCAVAIDGGLWEFYSTGVETEFEGLGIASVLVGAAIAAADAENARVVATCWYVEGWLDRHPEFQHLRDQRAAGDPDDSLCRIAPSIVKPKVG